MKFEQSVELLKYKTYNSLLKALMIFFIDTTVKKVCWILRTGSDRVQMKNEELHLFEKGGLFVYWMDFCSIVFSIDRNFAQQRWKTAWCHYKL